MYSYTIMFQCPSSCYSIKLVQPSHTLIRKHNLLSSVRPGSPWLSSENFLSLVLPTVLDDPALFGWLLLVATFLDPYSSMHHSRDSCSSSSVASPSSSWIPMFWFSISLLGLSPARETKRSGISKIQRHLGASALTVGWLQQIQSNSFKSTVENDSSIEIMQFTSRCSQQVY